MKTRAWVVLHPSGRAVLYIRGKYGTWSHEGSWTSRTWDRRLAL